MRTTTLAIVACLLGMAAGSGPDTLWVRRLDLGTDEYGNGIASRGTAIALAGSAWATSSNDVLVARLNQDGDTLWTRTFGDTVADDAAVSACIDAESNILVAGYGMSFKGAIRPRLLTPDAGAWTRSVPTKDQAVNSLIAKYDSAGELKWLRTDTNYLALGITADSAGNSYVSGAYYGGSYFDLWLAKLNPSGDTVWAREFDFDLLEIGYRVALDPSGNIALCAYVGDMDDFDCLTLKLTPGGDTIWTRRYDRSPDDVCCGVATDPSGNIIVAGRVVKDSTSDALVLKYDSSGFLVWDGVFDFDIDDGVMGATCDSAGDIYVAGYTGAYYVYDCLTMKLDSAGNVIWTTTYGGSNDDEADDVTCDGAGNPVIAGVATDSVTLSRDLLAIKYSALTGVAESHLPDPRPAATRGTITAAPDFVVSVPCPGRYDLRLCDLNGRVKQHLLHGHLSSGAHRFSLAGQPAGLYFVRVAAPDGGVSCQRLVLVK